MSSFHTTFWIIYITFYLAFITYAIITWWKIFQKAGQEGWKCLIPIYNVLVYLEIVKKPWWWLFLMCIPYLNYIWIIWSLNMLSKRFGKDEGFTVGLVLLNPIFIGILAFGKATYEDAPANVNTELLDSDIELK